MTCIVGLVDDGRVYIGADSASGQENSWTVRATKLPKVFRIGEFIIGYTDSFRMGQLLQYHLDVRPQNEESDMEYMVKVFAEAARETLKKYGFARVENNEETGGTFLVGYRKHLYTIDADFQVNEMADDMDACGCGAEYALGALRAVRKKTPVERILLALDVAAHFSGGVKPPFRVESDAT